MVQAGSRRYLLLITLSRNPNTTAIYYVLLINKSMHIIIYGHSFHALGVRHFVAIAWWFNACHSYQITKPNENSQRISIIRLNYVHALISLSLHSLRSATSLRFDRAASALLFWVKPYLSVRLLYIFDILAK